MPQFCFLSTPTIRVAKINIVVICANMQTPCVCQVRNMVKKERCGFPRASFLMERSLKGERTLGDGPFAEDVAPSLES